MAGLAGEPARQVAALKALVSGYDTGYVGQLPVVDRMGFLAARRRGECLPLCCPPPAVPVSVVTAEHTAEPVLWRYPCWRVAERLTESLTANQIRNTRVARSTAHRERSSTCVQFLDC